MTIKGIGEWGHHTIQLYYRGVRGEELRLNNFHCTSLHFNTLRFKKHLETVNYVECYKEVNLA